MASKCQMFWFHILGLSGSIDMSEGLILPEFDWDASCSLGSLLSDVMIIQQFPTELAKVISVVKEDQW